MSPHLDENALADRWSMSPRTLQRWRQKDQGPPFLKLGGRVVYRLIDVEAYELEQLHVTASPDTAPKTARP